MRVATWNMKQAVAPKQKLPLLWEWLEREVAPDIAVLTEAKVPKDGAPPGWASVFVDGGFGPRRRWGTVVAARGVELRPLSEVSVRGRTSPLSFRWPAGVTVVDAFRDGQRWATVVGLYGLTVNLRGESCGHGQFSVPTMLNELAPLFESDRGGRVLVAGDLNMWPRDAAVHIESTGLIDLVEATASSRSPLERCSGCLKGAACGHLWTHRNGNSPNAAVQQIDYILATDELARELRSVHGGVASYPDAWDVSDHAPVVADFA